MLDNSSRRGEKNSQYGSFWVTNGEKNIKLKAGEEVPNGYMRGRFCGGRKPRKSRRKNGLGVNSHGLLVRGLDQDQITKNIIISENGCWIWSRSCTSAGYGQLTYKKKYWTAHRYSYVAFCGFIPDGLIVRHLYHDRKCCNPEHLATGTYQDNYLDSLQVYMACAKQRRGRWLVNGVSYETCRHVREATGLNYHAIIKYTKNGVFDIDSYRKDCLASGRIPIV